jgi:hypothetical protein
VLVGDVLVLTFSGVASGIDSIVLPPNISGYGFSLVVPSSVPDGTLTLTVAVPAVEQTVQGAVQIKDNIPPVLDSVGMRFGGALPSGALLLVSGWTNTLQVWASDNHALAWIGWSLGPPLNVQDSIAVTGTTAGADLPLAIPQSLGGDTASLAIFVSDGDGNHDTLDVSHIGIISTLSHPVRTAPVLDTITDLAFDQKRGLIYLAQPDSQRIAVLSLATMTYQPPILFPGRPISLDLTPGGDSLVVAPDSSTSLTIVRLVGTPQLIGTLPVAPDNEIYNEYLVYRVRVASNGQAVVIMRTTTGSNGYFTANFLNLATDSTWIQPGGEDGFFIGAPPPSARSADGTIVAVPGEGGVLYNVTTGEIDGGGAPWNPAKPFSVAMSNASSNVRMFNHAIYYVSTGGAAGLGLDSLYGTSVASNGTDGYAAESACSPFDATCVDTATGALLQYALSPQATSIVSLAGLPHIAPSLIVSPDNKTLVAIGADTIMAVDLTTSSPPSTAVLANLRRILASRSERIFARHAARSRTVAPGTNDAVWSLRSMLTVRERHR